MNEIAPDFASPRDPVIDTASQAFPAACSPVPALFRLTLINTAKRHQPVRAEVPAQRHSRRYRDRRQKFELYSDATTISD